MLGILVQRPPHLAALKVKRMMPNSPGKSLISQRVSPIWSSAVHRRAAGGGGRRQSVWRILWKPAQPVIPLFPFCKNDTFWQPSCCADFMPTGKTCVRWCNHDVRVDFSCKHKEREGKKREEEENEGFLNHNQRALRRKRLYQTRFELKITTLHPLQPPTLMLFTARRILPNRGQRHPPRRCHKYITAVAKTRQPALLQRLWSYSFICH